MATAANPQPYTAFAKLLHWLIALLVAAQFVVAWFMPHIGRNARAEGLVRLHFTLGVLILLVMIVRWIHRLRFPVPLEMPDAPTWERWAAHWMHIAIYAILLVSPWLGWASASAHNLPVRLFAIPLPALAPPKAGWALEAGDIHTWSMWVLLALVALHALAALYHYFVRRDGVLQRMLPASAGREEAADRRA